jgi:thiol-disulfide isomerase/thioredoxin
MPATILPHIEDRHDFQRILNENTGVVLLKFSAEWCAPCKSITPFVKQTFEKLPENFTIYELDVDDNFEIYVYLKSKKMITGIPALLAYYRGNTSFASDESISGASEPSYRDFFAKCISQAATY